MTNLSKAFEVLGRVALKEKEAKAQDIARRYGGGAIPYHAAMAALGNAFPEAPERYDAAPHIFNWARNDSSLCREMHKVRSPGNFITVMGQAQAALNLAYRTTREGKDDIPRQLVEPSDLLQASIMFLDWDGES
jgi:hypothetical protein